MEVARASVFAWVWVIGMWLVILAVLAAIVLLVRVAYRGGPIRIHPAIVAAFLGGFMTMCVAAPCNHYKDYIPAIGENGGRLVSALERYVAENGTPPDTLELLVPKYIAEIPATGYPSQQRFRYVQGMGTDFRNREKKVAYWNLEVDCSCWWEQFGSTYDWVDADSRQPPEEQWSVPRR